MSTSWDQVLGNPEYRALSPDEQNNARQQYFNDVVAPHVPSEHINDARQQFEAYHASKSPYEEKAMKDMAVQAQSMDPLAAVTGYGANLVSMVPGLKEAGSGLAAAAGYGDGDSFSDRYNNLEKAQQAMREAGVQLHPVATRAGQGIAFLESAAALPVAEAKNLDLLQKMAMGFKTGAGYGAAYGAGDANSFASDENAMKERLGSAVTGAEMGAVGGAAIPAAIEYAPQAYSGAKEAYSGVKKILADPKTGDVVDQWLKTNLPSAQKSAAKAAANKVVDPKDLRETNMFPMSSGQITQNPELQRLEADYASGAMGPQAQQAANEFRASQNQALHDHLSGLGSVREGGHPVDSIAIVSGTIKGNAKLAKKAVDDAYERARILASNNPNSVSNGIVLAPRDLQENLMPKITEVAKEYTIDAGATPKAHAIMNRLVNETEGQGNKGWVDLTSLEGWRKAATKMAFNTTDAAEKSAIRRMISTYDDYMSGAAERMTGQTGEAINAFKEAVGTRRQYGNMFEGNDVLESIVDGTKSIDDIARDFVGSASTASKQGMLDDYSALIRASGAQAPLVRGQLQNAFAQKIYNRVADGKLANSNIDAISPAKLKTELENMFVNQKELATALYGEEAVAQANAAIKELNLITSKQSNVGNASNSGYTLDRLQRMANASGFLSHIPGYKWTADIGKSALSAIRNGKYGTEAAQSFTGRIPKSMESKVPKITITRPSQWKGKASGGRAYAQGGSVNTSPTEAQKAAGNYKKDHIKIYGLNIAIENPKGSERSGTDKNGKSWSVEMPHHYGYIKGTVGADKDHVDCYVGDKLGSPKVFVVDQKHSDSGKFDEHKCMLGFMDAESAIKAYIKAFSDKKGHLRIGKVTPMTIEQFKKWLDHGDTTKPVPSHSHSREMRA